MVFSMAVMFGYRMSAFSCQGFIQTLQEINYTFHIKNMSSVILINDSNQCDGSGTVPNIEYNNRDHI
jgi:hypothetical protein